MAYHRLEQDLANCTYCPKLCRFSCPVSEVTGNEALTPRQKVLSLSLARRGSLPVDDELARLQYACIGCYACSEYCDLDNDVPLALEVGRELVRAAGCEPASVTALAQSFEHCGAPQGELLADVLAGLDVEVGPADATVVFFPSCRLVADRAMLAPTIAVLRAAAPSPVRLDTGAERCCGLPLLHLGRSDRFLATARRVAEQLASASVVITDDPACAYTLQSRYQQVGVTLRAEVLHTVEFIHRHRERLEPQLDLTRRLDNTALHQPCYLARKLDGRHQTEELYRLVANQAARKPVWHGRDTGCCGGSLHHHVDPELSDAIAERRLADLRSTGADRVVSACPTCHHNLSGRGVELVDLVAQLATMLKDEPA